MKKIISAILCTALIAIGIISADGAETSSDSSIGISFNDFANEYTVVGEDYIPNNCVRLYKESNRIDPQAGIRFIECAGGQQSTQYFNFPRTKDLYLSSSNGYEYEHLLHNGSSNGIFLLNYNKTGGTYQKVRINLKKYTDYFNSHGECTVSLGGEVHNYNFTKEFDGIHSSSLLVISGGAVSAVSPNHNGMVEFYVSTNIGDITFFTTDFRIEKGTNSASGGGVTGQRLPGLTIGDTDKDGYVDIYDATCIQKHLAEIELLSGVALRNADVNRDGKYDIADVTVLQKYVADLKN